MCVSLILSIYLMLCFVGSTDVDRLDIRGAKNNGGKQGLSARYLSLSVI